MKFFEAVPDELFSPLASPNRALYADALDVLCMAYRQKLRLPEDELYSMLRSRLEQQLADATFEGEDIDENELRDISGARFLIRKLCAKGWFEKERGPDFREYITVPGYASRLLELFHELRDDRPARGFSYVFGTYSALRVADETGSAYEKMAAVYTAFDNTQALIRLLRLVYHNVKHYFQMQLEMHDVGEVLFRPISMISVRRLSRRTSVRSRSRTSVPKYRVPIRTVLMRWAEDDEQLAAMARAAQQERRGGTMEDCRADILRRIFWVQECYDDLEHDYLDEIDAQVRRHTRAATQKIEKPHEPGAERSRRPRRRADRALAQPQGGRPDRQAAAGVSAV